MTKGVVRTWHNSLSGAGKERAQTREFKEEERTWEVSLGTKPSHFPVQKPDREKL